ncbi:MAG: hypothetical protein EOO60_02425 [Hymenobacter sp.]|nr:MAG: hypothetical protein EOO60_02425 [Hymenobacter sp.]
MLLNTNTDPRDHSTCALSYEEEYKWLRATWRGYVDPIEAMRGAEAYLQHAARTPCPLLLNDNSQLRGPWFDSLDWLAEIWVPQASRLGLRYIAHVLQADRHSDIIPARMPASVPFELQIFQSLEDAQQWLQQWRTIPT